MNIWVFIFIFGLRIQIMDVMAWNAPANDDLAGEVLGCVCSW